MHLRVAEVAEAMSVIVVVNVGVNVFEPSPGWRSSAGTTKIGSAGELVESVTVTVGFVDLKPGRTR